MFDLIGSNNVSPLFYPSSDVEPESVWRATMTHSQPQNNPVTIATLIDKALLFLTLFVFAFFVRAWHEMWGSLRCQTRPHTKSRALSLRCWSVLHFTVSTVAVTDSAEKGRLGQEPHIVWRISHVGRPEGVYLSNLEEKQSSNATRSRQNNTPGP